METVVFLTDFSESATHAFDFLKELVKRTHIKSVIIYHSYAYANDDVYDFGDIMLTSSVPTNKEIVAVESKLNLLQEELEKVFTTVEIRWLASRKLVVDAIDEISQNFYHVDLVVMGIHGADDRGRNSIGSIPNQLIQAHRYDLLLIPSGVRSFNFSRILLALDLRNLRQRLPLNKVYSLHQLFSPRWHIVNVDVGDRHTATDLLDEQSFLHEKLDPLNPLYAYIEGSDLVNSLSMYAGKHEVDLLVTVPRKLGFLTSFFQRSASKKLAVHVSIPIMMLMK